MSQNFHGNVENVAGRDVVVNNGFAPPSEDHPKSYRCPQCKKLTWRDTELCINCGHNIKEHIRKSADAMLILVVLAIIFVAGLAKYIGLLTAQEVSGIFIVAVLFCAIATNNNTRK